MYGTDVYATTLYTELSTYMKEDARMQKISI